MVKNIPAMTAVLLIAALALLVRVPGLDKSFQGDEYLSVLDASRLRDIPQALMADAHPPLYFYLLNFWKRVSMDEAYLRLLSVIPGIGLCILVYLIGRAVGRRGDAVFLAVLTALCPGLVWVSQYVRTYSWAFFFIAASVYLLVLLIKRRDSGANSPWLWAGYVAFSAAALYTFYFSALVLLAENLFIAVYFRKRLSYLFAWVLSQCSIALLYAPWIPFFLRQRSSYANHPQVTEQLGFHVGPIHAGSVIRALFGMAGLDPRFMATQIYSNHEFLKAAGIVFALLCAAGLIGASALAVRTIRADPGSDAGAFLPFFFILGAVPFAAALAINHAAKVVLTSHYLLPCFIFLAIFLSLALRAVPAGKAAAALCLTVMALFALRLVTLYQDRGMDFKSARAYLKTAPLPGAIMVAPSEGFAQICGYYFADIHAMKRADDAGLLSSLKSAVLFVTADGKLELKKNSARLRSLLKERKYTLKGSRSFGDLLIERYSL